MLLQNFTARMPLLTATSAFRLGRRRWSSPQHCSPYLLSPYRCYHCMMISVAGPVCTHRPVLLCFVITAHSILLPVVFTSVLYLIIIILWCDFAPYITLSAVRATVNASRWWFSCSSIVCDIWFLLRIIFVGHFCGLSQMIWEGLDTKHFWCVILPKSRHSCVSWPYKKRTGVKYRGGISQLDESAWPR